MTWRLSGELSDEDGGSYIFTPHFSKFNCCNLTLSALMPLALRLGLVCWTEEEEEDEPFFSLVESFRS